MSGIFDQVINYAPPSLLLGTVTYKGTWSAATNTPTLLNPPSSITNGNYYVVSAAGTQFSLSFNIGDWIISNGSAWEKVDNTDAVSSVFGRMGAVVGVSTDYSAVGITNTALGASNPSTVAATTVTATSTIAATGAVTGSNLSGTNTGDQTITLTGGVTGSGTGSFAATVVTNANLTGVITSSGNATSIASQTGTGTKFVVDTSPVLVTPNIGIATGTSLAAALNGTLGATTPSTIAATTISATGIISSTSNNPSAEFGKGNGTAASVRLNPHTATYYNWSIDNGVTSSGTLNIAPSTAVGGNTYTTPVAIFTTTGLNSTAIGATTPSTGAFTTVSASGLTTATGGVSFPTAAGQTAGSIAKNAAYGLSIFGVTGSTYDLALLGNSSAVALGITTGGVNLVTGGNLAVTGTLSATGQISAAVGLVVQGYSVPASGAGLELTYAPSGPWTQQVSYNRTTGAWLDHKIYAKNTEVLSSASSVAIFSSTGLAVTGQFSASYAGNNYLTVNGSAAGNEAGLQFQRAGSYKWYIANNSSDQLYFFTAGTTIATMATTGFSVVAGTFTTTGITMGSGTGTVSATAGVFSVTSDLRAKNPIGKFTKGLAEIVALADHSEIYSFKSDEKNTPRAGWYAQDVEPLIPEAVFHDGADGMASLDERPIVVALVNAVKELSARLAALEAK